MTPASAPQARNPRQPGSPVTLNPFDVHRDQRDPAPGDTILTAAGTTAYLVTEARRVASTIHPHRWSLRCVRIDPAEAAEPDYTLHWYPRSRR